MPADKTGIHFINEVTDTDTLNILDYLYYYNGGGVAIGDFDNDGLPDIYFTSNLGSNKLYHNKGNFQFDDITGTAGVAGKGNWKTGVTLADVNGDGYLDIYVSEVGGYKNLRGRNELFINNDNDASSTGIRFTEQAADYGLDIKGFNTQAVFLDYDNDGDLDMFLVNHSVHSNASYGDSSMRRLKDAASGDKLFRNDSTGTGRKFTEVTEAAGIYSSVVGYGLNAVVDDLNNDGWCDIYVSNDFHENDYYYLNNKNGTFSEINRDAFAHESRFSMGSAIADMNNDGWPDIITLDMLPDNEKNLKSSAGDDPVDIYNYKFSYGYYHQYSRNCLQLNVGRGKKFSDIALYSGIAATDWSWSPLAADFDNDGIKDLFITNGILRRPNDLDFIKYYSAMANQDTTAASDLATINRMPQGKMANYFYKGNGNLKFLDESSTWIKNHPGLSNGAACADLDNDGDLDIVINNINEPATIYRNNSVGQNGNHFIDIILKGPVHNSFGIGAKVFIKQGEKIQAGYQTATKGFESASLQYVHFGLGNDTAIAKVEVIWPDGKMQVLKNVRADRRLTCHYAEAMYLNTPGPLFTDSIAPLFTDITNRIHLPYVHHENSFTDFNVQALIPHMVSTLGPRLSVADINGDGLDDFYIGGAKGQAGSLFLQTPAGNFVTSFQPAFNADSLCEDVNAVFFDADNDGDKDLYVVSGGNETEQQENNLDRLYLNDGHGGFDRSQAFLKLYGNKSVAVAADFDHDGDLDLFVGGNVIAGNYGLVPKSYLLINDGHGVFTAAPENTAPGLSHIGMVTDAIWADLNNDGWPELVVAGAWMPVCIFKNDKGRLVNNTSTAGLEHTTGLWNTLHIADVDNDGYLDILAGNLGENSKLKVGTGSPLKLYTGDFDGNGVLDQLLTIQKNGQYYPFPGKEELEKQLPAVLRKKYSNYGSMAGESVEAIFGEKLKHANLQIAETLSSSLLVNNGKGVFTITPLPGPAQWSPVYAFVTKDFNHDGKTAILSAGNFYGVLPYENRYDAGYGTVMLNNNNHGFSCLAFAASGLLADGEVRDMKILKSATGSYMIAVSRNNGPISFFISR